MANVIYSNARAKAMENYLVGADKLGRMLECSDANEALKVLAEVNFGEGATIESPLEFEKLISAEEKKLIAFIKETCAKKSVKEFFLYKYDYHNAETLMKMKHLNIAIDDLRDPDGIFSFDEMKEKILVDDYGSFPATLKDALLKADMMFVEEKATGPEISGLFKKAYYKELSALSKSDKLLKKIYSVKADSVNIAVALRTRNYQKAKEFFVEGGNLTSEQLQYISEQQPESIKEDFVFSEVRELIDYACDSFIKGVPLSEFEREAESYALKYLKKDKYSISGMHPYIQYIYSKKAELENVRIILVGLINSLEKTEIRKRLRESYEG